MGEGGEGMVGQMGLHVLGRFADLMDALAAAGVTVGCSTQPLRFCPDQLVTRGQMATFLARATGVVATPSP